MRAQLRSRWLRRVAALGVPAWLAVLAIASGAGADARRWFEGSDKVYIRQHEQLVRIQEPRFHMTQARRAFAKGLRSVAADDFEKAAAGFAYFRDRAAGDNRKQLDLASRALDKLGDDIRRGKVDEVTTLDRAIEDAERVLRGLPETPPAPAAPTPDAEAEPETM